MADEKNNSDEPSIEEILSSIREIISEDDEEEGIAKQDAPAPAKPVSEPVAAEEEDDDVLDLSQFAAADEPQSEKAPADPFDSIAVAQPESDDFDIVEMVDSDDGLADILGNDDEEEEDDMPVEDVFEAPVINAAQDTESDEKDALIDKVAEGATVSAMARLAENISLARSADGVTLEDIVRDLLRPMLKNWLDENLPDIIERLVSQELERLAQKAVRK